MNKKQSEIMSETCIVGNACICIGFYDFAKKSKLLFEYVIIEDILRRI